ncbi:MAG: transposase [Thermodesulfovibrionales bacterium]|nr:transposase [Thermodesulfovibrionales bacterium]
MFRKNTFHLQSSLFGIASQLPEAKLKKLKQSKEYEFYRLVFCKINEKEFSALYSDNCSRPNAPVNSLVASIILMYHNNWTTEKLFDRIDFDLLTRTALGLDTLEQTPFCPATFFNFQNRLLSHFVATGENLLEGVFDSLTQQQLKRLKIKTDIQRSDSFMAMSNIRSYSRTQLLIEMLIRLYRVLSDEDKVRFNDILAPYIKQSSGQYIYDLQRASIPHEQEKLGQLYHKLYEALKESYGDFEVFSVFERVYTEHFTIIDDKITVRAPKELNGSTLQSPDDIDAAYRQKRGRHYRGQSVNITETANPENDVNLITDVAVCSNNTDDSKILNGRIEPIKEKTPDLNELHTDGAYGSEDNDKKMEELDITHVQTAVRGRKAEISIQIEEVSDGQYTVKCPHQSVISQKTKTRYKACFDVEICKQCPLSRNCPARQQNDKRTYYFDRSDYLLGKRNRNIKSLPPERRKLRPNVEATVKEFTKSFNHKGKLRVRGLFKTIVYAHAMAISINFGRVWRYMIENPDFFALSNLLCLILPCLFTRNSRNGLPKIIIRDKSPCWLEPQQYFRRAA